MTAISISALLDRPRACWIFDLDGTLSDDRDRLARLEPDDREVSGAWEPYNAAHTHDPVVAPIAALFRQVLDAGHSALILTRRPDHHRPSTEVWLRDASIGFNPKRTPLIMAPSGTTCQPQTWKARVFPVIAARAAPVPCIVVDDDPRVLSVARDQGMLALKPRLPVQGHVCRGGSQGILARMQ